METFLSKELEAELNLVTLEYVYKNPIGSTSSMIKRNILSRHLKPHAKILLDWMVEETISYDEEIYNCLMSNNIVLAGLYLAQLGNLIFHISKKIESPFNIIYCPDPIQDFQKLRLRLWREYFLKHQKYYEINHMKKDGENIVYVADQLDSFFEEHQILDDEYIRNLTKKFNS